MNNATYAAAIIHLLDRETGKVKTMYCYPITRVEFVDQNAAPQMSYGVIDGQWAKDDPMISTIPHPRPS